MQQRTKWQPVMLVTERRLECGECQALAVFVLIEDTVSSDGERDFDYSAYCQDCFLKAQKEEEDNE